MYQGMRGRPLIDEEEDPREHLRKSADIPFPLDAKAHLPDNVKVSAQFNLAPSPKELIALWSSQISELRRDEEK